jgi:hypothetical protein
MIAGMLNIVTSDLFLAVVGELRKWLRRAYNPYTYKNSAFLLITFVSYSPFKGFHL